MPTTLIIKTKNRISSKKKRQRNGDDGYLKTETDLIKKKTYWHRILRPDGPVQPHPLEPDITLNRKTPRETYESRNDSPSSSYHLYRTCARSWICLSVERYSLSRNSIAAASFRIFATCIPADSSCSMCLSSFSGRRWFRGA